MASSHKTFNGGGSIWGGNPLGGPRNFTIMGTLQPPTIRYGRLPTPKYRVAPTQHTASITEQGRRGKTRRVSVGEKAKVY
jgi:hypothetical protein